MLGDPEEEGDKLQHVTIKDEGKGKRLAVFAMDESGHALVYLSEPYRSEFIRKIKELPHD